MEVYQDIRFINSYENMVLQELKPMKGIDFDKDVQAFEQALRLNGLDNVENINTENFISSFDKALFDKVGEFKISVDQKLDDIHSLFKSKKELGMKDLLKIQYQTGMFLVEVTAVSTGSDKVSDGIITLFQTR